VDALAKGVENEHHGGKPKKGMKMRRLFAYGCVLLLLAATSCGSPTAPTNTPNATTGTSTTPTTPSAAPGVTPADGTWQGASPEGAQIFFDTAGSVITHYSFKQLPGCSALIETGGSTHTAVSGGSFTLDLSFNSWIGGTMTGTFTSGTASSGELRIVYKTICSGSYNGTWSAKKM
jgi:hypothetical protein